MRYKTILLAAVLPSLGLLACSGENNGATSTSGGSGESASSGGANAYPKDPKTGLRVSELGPVPPLPEWADNPPTEAKKTLGRDLFSDPRLSGSGYQACGNCHLSTGDFQSGGPLDLPDRSYPNIKPTLHRHAPSLLNIVYAPMLRWDGSYYTNLYNTMVLPFAEPNMNLTPDVPAGDIETVDIPGAQKTLFKRLTVEAPGYVKLFQDAFAQDITKLAAEDVWLLAGKALAVYIRVAVSRDAAFDKWNAGDDSAIGEDAIRGLTLFRGKALCVACHNGPLFSDFKFHNMSLSLPDASGKRPDEGRYNVTKQEKDRGAFLTPTLRSCVDTLPYFHDGSSRNLASVIKHLTTDEVRKDPLHDPLLDAMPLLTDAEISDLLAFLKTLRGAQIPLSELQAPTMLP